MKLRSAAICLLLAGPAWPQDARTIVLHAIENDRKQQDAAINYTYLQRMETRSVDSAGNVKSRHSRTTDITRLEGSPYRRQVAVDDKPLPPKEQRKEDEKLQASIEERRKESPEQREHRLADWRHRQEKNRAALKELPEAFDLKLAAEETIDGRPMYVIDAAPRPGYKPKSQATQFLPKVKARFWIDKGEEQWVKLDMESLDTITFGGVLVRLAKGSHLIIEQTRVNNELWLPKYALLKAAARVMLLYPVREEIEFTFTDYKKFQTDSRVISSGQNP